MSLPDPSYEQTADWYDDKIISQFNYPDVYGLTEADLVKLEVKQIKLEPKACNKCGIVYYLMHKCHDGKIHY